MTQSLPADDLFTVTGSTPTWPPWPQAWVPVKTLSGAEVASGYSLLLDSDPGDLHNAYKDATRLYRSRSYWRCAASDGTPVTTTGELSAHVWRAVHTASDVKVAAWFSVHMTGNGGPMPTGATAGKRFWGVSARVQSGITGGTPSGSWFERPTGYYFGMANLGANNCKFQLFRANYTGGPTNFVLLAETAAVSFADLLPTQASFMLRMEVATVGSQVELRCFTDVVPKPSIGEQLAISFDDTSGSRITTAGRCGFIMNRELREGIVDTVTIIDAWELYVGGVFIMRDEFERADPVLAKPVFDAFGAGGQNLGSLYNGDQFGAYNQVLLRSTSGTWPDRVMVDPTAVVSGNPAAPDNGGYFLCQRAASDVRAQHRSVRVVFGSAGTNPANWRDAAIALRCEGGTGDTMPKRGYLATMRLAPASSEIRISRFYTDPGTQVTTLKRCAFNSSPGILQDTEYLFDFEVFNLTSANGAPDGICVLKVKLGASQVVLLADPLANGVSCDAAGTMYDVGTERTVLGVQEGFRMFATSGSKLTFIDTWQQEALTTPGGSIPANQQASIPFLSETHNHSGQTLNLPLSWPVEHIEAFEVLSVQYEDGYAQSRLRYPRARRSWVVQANAATVAQKDTLRTFWAAHLGCEKAFNWQEPDGSTVNVHFFDERLTTTFANPGVHRFSFVLEELFP